MKTVTEIIKDMRSAAGSSLTPTEEPEQPQQDVNCVSLCFDGSEFRKKGFRKVWFRMDESHPDVLDMCVATEMWVRRYLLGSPNNRLLVIYGRTGTGKSMVSRKALAAIGAIGISAWHEGFRGKCPGPRAAFEWSQICAMGPADRNEGTLWIDAMEADALILQDIGTEVDRFKSDVGTENLRLILEGRRNKWTIITTNIPPEHWSEAWDARVDRRLNTNSVIVSVRNAPTFKKVK